MSINTKLYVKHGEVYVSVGEVETITPPSIKGRYEEIIYQGGTGEVLQYPTGIVEFSGGEIALYWNTEYTEAKRNLMHVRLIRAALDQDKKSFRIRFQPSGWLWNFNAYVEEFNAKVTKEGKERAILKLKPTGTVLFEYPGELVGEKLTDSESKV